MKKINLIIVNAFLALVSMFVIASAYGFDGQPCNTEQLPICSTNYPEIGCIFVYEAFHPCCNSYLYYCCSRSCRRVTCTLPQNASNYQYCNTDQPIEITPGFSMSLPCHNDKCTLPID